MGTIRNNISGYDLKAIKLLSYINEDNNKRTVSWYVDQLAEYKLGKWNTIIDLGTDTIEEVISPDLIREEQYLVSTNTEGKNAQLHLQPIAIIGGVVAQIYENGVVTSTCQVSSETDYVSIQSATAFNYNDLSIYKNGVLQVKGVDVNFTAQDVISFTNELDKGDIIIIRKQVGM